MKHSQIAGCIIALTLGKGLPFDAEVEKGQETLGDISCPVPLADGTQFVTCAGEQEGAQALFKVSADEQLDRCREDAEGALSTLQLVEEE